MDESDKIDLTDLLKDVEKVVASDAEMSAMLKRCAELLVRHLDVSFARLWTLNASRDVLVLQASAGCYTHLDGKHSRISVGAFKIGRIARQQKPHLTNDVMNDPAVDREWAASEGMQAFAGYPLLVDGELYGVMGMFAKHPLSPGVIDTLATIAGTVAVGIEEREIGEY